MCSRTYSVIHLPSLSACSVVGVVIVSEDRLDVELDEGLNEAGRF